MKREGRAFTLLELLVVIAVIVVLSALLLSSLNRAKIAADTTACRSNLRQIILGINLYAQQEHFYPDKDMWPIELKPFVGASWPDNNYLANDPAVWIDLKYIGPAQGVYVCPAYNRKGGAFMSRIVSPVLPGQVTSWLGLGSYGYNAWSWGLCTPPTGRGLGGVVTVLTQVGGAIPLAWKATPEGQVVCPVDMIAMADVPILDPGTGGPCGQANLSVNFGAGIGNSVYNMVVRGLPADDPMVRLMGWRHAGRFNTAFCDGHVETLRGKKLFEIRDPAVARRWNSDHDPHQDLVWPAPPPP